jgi:circadian clock protein KaiC
MDEDIRTKTGIQGFDKALNGGVPKGNIVLVAGGAGTGKSTLCLQIAVEGASTFGEKSLYISTEQNKEELYHQARSFGWPLEELENKQLLKIIYFDVTEGDSFLEKMNTLIESFEPKRLVVDSLTTLSDSMLVSGVLEDKGFSMVQIAETVNPIPRTEKIISKTLLYHLFKEIKQHKVTAFLTTELPEDHKQLSADGISEFIADGVIALHYLGIGGMDSRNMQIRKMRYTSHNKDFMPYKIEKSGILINVDDSSGVLMK